MHDPAIMAGRVNKRKVREENPNKSDSDDETYEDKARRPSRQRSGRTTPKKKKKASRRKARNDDSDDDIADSSEAEEDDLSTNLVSEAEPVELNPVTGRPRRSVRKRPVVYDDGSSDTDELAREDEVEQKQEEGKGGDEEDEVKEKRLRPRRGAKSEQAPKPTLTLKLKMPEPRPGSSGKRTRGGSVPGAKRGYSNEPQSAGVRRSGRLHPEDPEPVIALTTSGKHAEVVRPGTRSPEGLPRAAIRGGKSLPASAGSAIYEEDEDEDADGAGNLQELRPKNEDADEGAESGHGEDDGNGGGRSGLAAEEPPSAAAGPSGRQRVSSENGEGILSVEDSDPERAEQMVRSTSKRSLADDDQIASTGAVVLEHDQDKDAEAEAEAEAAGDGNGDDDDDDDEEPISNGRRRKAKVPDPIPSEFLERRDLTSVSAFPPPPRTGPCCHRRAGRKPNSEEATSERHAEAKQRLRVQPRRRRGRRDIRFRTLARVGRARRAGGTPPAYAQATAGRGVRSDQIRRLFSVAEAEEGRRLPSHQAGSACAGGHGDRADRDADATRSRWRPSVVEAPSLPDRRALRRALGSRNDVRRCGRPARSRGRRVGQQRRRASATTHGSAWRGRNDAHDGSRLEPASGRPGAQLGPRPRRLGDDGEPGQDQGPKGPRRRRSSRRRPEHHLRQRRRLAGPRQPAQGDGDPASALPRDLPAVPPDPAAWRALPRAAGHGQDPARPGLGRHRELAGPKDHVLHAQGRGRSKQVGRRGRTAAQVALRGGAGEPAQHHLLRRDRRYARRSLPDLRAVSAPC